MECSKKFIIFYNDINIYKIENNYNENNESNENKINFIDLKKWKFKIWWWWLIFIFYKYTSLFFINKIKYQQRNIVYYYICYI